MFSQFQHQSIDYSANSPKQTNIPAGGMINEIMCELSMAPTIAGASNTAALAMRGDEFGVIGSLQLKGEDALPIIDLPGSFIKWLHWYNYGAPLKVPSTFADGSTANPVISTCFILPMWSTGSAKPFDSSLDNTAEPNGLTLTCNWLDHTKVNSAASAFTTSPTLKVFTNESPASAHPFLRKRTFYAQQTFSATGNQRLNLEPGNAYRRFFVNTRDGSNNDAATRFSTVALYVGGQLKQIATEALLLQAQNLRRGMRFGETIVKNTVELNTANYIWEQAIDGYLTHTADTTRRQGNYLEFNITTAPTTITVVYEVLDDLRAEQNAKRSARGRAA
jgi:hypothetical protein